MANYKNQPTKDELELNALLRAEKMATARAYACMSGEISWRSSEKEAHRLQFEQTAVRIRAIQGRMAADQFSEMDSMQSEDTSATRDPPKEACLARGAWVDS